MVTVVKQPAGETRGKVAAGPDTGQRHRASPRPYASESAGLDRLPIKSALAWENRAFRRSCPRRGKGTFQVNNTARRPKITVSADGQGLVCQAGALLLAEAARVTGLGEALTTGLARWRAPRAVHGPGKILTHLAVALALGGDCLADVAVLRAQPQLCGPVASGPVVSRLITALAAGAPRALAATGTARAAARQRAWGLAGDRAPGADGNLIPAGTGATIVLARPEKEKAAPAWKKTYGFHPLAAFAGHGAGAGGEALAIVLRAGNTGQIPPAGTSR
jgi:DDE family transposase